MSDASGVDGASRRPRAGGRRASGASEAEAARSASPARTSSPSSIIVIPRLVVAVDRREVRPGLIDRARPPVVRRRRPDRAPDRVLRVRRRRVGWRVGSMPPQQDRDRGRDEDQRHDLRRRDAEERPVVAAERLEDEPHGAVPDEEHHRDVARAESRPEAVTDPQQDQHPDQARYQFVQEQRMEAGRRLGERRARIRRDAVGAVDRDAPGQRRRRAVQLLVEEVAPARDGLHEEQGGRDDVGPAPERQVVPARVPDQREQSGHDPAVDAKAGVRGQEDLDRVARVERPLVDHVVQPAADQRRDRHDDHPVADDIGILAGPFRETGDQEVRGGKTDGIADAVPADRDRADLEGDGIGGEVEHPRSVPAGRARPGSRALGRPAREGR